MLFIEATECSGRVQKIMTTWKCSALDYLLPVCRTFSGKRGKK